MSSSIGGTDDAMAGTNEDKAVGKKAYLGIEAAWKN